MRLLHAARLSRLGDASTGLDKQDDDARAYASLGGHEIVATAADSDVSGDTDPWSRPALGPWLSDPERVAQYDGIVASHVDRLARSTIYFMRLLHWADEHGKTIITTGEQGIDFSSPVGKLLGYIISWLGEQELAAIKRRHESTRAWLYRHEYLHGRPPFGYEIVSKDEHKTLAPDPVTAPIVREMVDRYLAGETMLSIAQWLDNKAPTPSGMPQWGVTSVGWVLRSSTLIGRRKTRKGQTVLRFEPLIDRAKYARLQQELDRRKTRHGAVAPDTALLTGVAVCAECGGPMYRHRSKQKRTSGEYKSYDYYRCHGSKRHPSKCSNTIRTADLDAWLDDWFLSEPLGDHEVIERIVIPGNGHQDELDANAADMADLLAAQDDMDDDAFTDKLVALRTERKRLQALPAEPDQVVERGTGVTLAELWQTLDTAAKRQHLLAAGVKVVAWRNDQSRWTLKGDPYRVVSAVAGSTGGEWRALGDEDI